MAKKNCSTSPLHTGSDPLLLFGQTRVVFRKYVALGAAPGSCDLFIQLQQGKEKEVVVNVDNNVIYERANW